jgi:hypothetical protein
MRSELEFLNHQPGTHHRSRKTYKCSQHPLAIIAKISASTEVSQFPAKNRHGKGKKLKTNYHKQHKRDSNND